MALISPASLCLLFPLAVSWQVLADDLAHNRSTLVLDIISDSQNTTDGIHDVILEDSETSENTDDATPLTPRKCCPLDHYYDSSYQCIKRTSDMPDNIALVKNFLPNASHKDVNTFHAGNLNCQSYLTFYHANAAFFDGSGQLCDYSGNCYSNSSYCIEHKLDEDNSTLTAMAYGCHITGFRKCCPQDQIFSEAGCMNNSDTLISDSMRELQERLPSKTGFPLIDGKPCELVSLGVQDTEPHWLIDYYGFLTRSQLTSSTDLYCVDDQTHNNTAPHLMAHICLSEIDKIKTQDKIGKCCYENEYFMLNGSTSNCIPADNRKSLLDYPQLRHLSYAQQVLSGYIPPCQNGAFISYFLDEEESNYGVMLNSGEIEIVSKVSGRELGRQRLNSEDYCVDSTVGRNGGEELLALVCIDQSAKDSSAYGGKFTLTSILLGLSCVSLFISSILILTKRVRRGAATVYMVKTLTGKILLSYVASTMLAFLVLIINKQVTFLQGSRACFIIAGFQLFLLLSSFFWNSSICLEMLFLTLGIRGSELRRYFGHCLWALGIPASITTLAFVLDSYRDQLPDTIVPLIGVIRCSFSEKKAELLYQYVPIMITVLVNIVALVAASHIRSVKLRQLEKSGLSLSGRPPFKDSQKDFSVDEESRQNGDIKSKVYGSTSYTNSHNNGHENNNASKDVQSRVRSSGLAAHHAHITWKESLKLGLWSGSTWLLEVLIFVIFKFWVEPSGAWYEYLTYVPVIINSLRGVGIFFILVCTSDNRAKWTKILHELSVRSKLYRPLSTIGRFISTKRQYTPESSVAESISATTV